MTVLNTESRIESERLLFVPTWCAESDSISKIANDIDIAVAVGEAFPFPYTLDDANNFKSYTHASWISGREYNFGIFLKNTNEYIGNIGFKISSDETIVNNIGYWLGKIYHGHGYATESLHEFIKFIRKKYPIAKEIKAGVYDYNIASQKVLEKCGFVKTGLVDEKNKLRNGIFAQNIKYNLSMYKSKGTFLREHFEK